MEKSVVGELIGTLMSAKNIREIIQTKELSSPLKVSETKRDELLKAIQSFDHFFDTAILKRGKGENPIMIFYHLKNSGFEFDGDMEFFNELSFEEILKIISNGAKIVKEDELTTVEEPKFENGDFVKISGKEYGIFESYKGKDKGTSLVFTKDGSTIVNNLFLEKVVDENEKIIATILVEAELGSNIEVYNEDGSYSELKIVKLDGNFVLMNNENYGIIRVTATTTLYNIATFIVNFYKPSKVVVY